MMRTFLTAEWRHLLMLNYVVDPDLLCSHVPRGVELDSWNGKTYVSMVGFLFLRTKVMGLPVPFHRNFEEVNLRFYVRRRGPEGWRRGVVFIKEIVPRRLIASVARVCYNEPYVALPMSHRIDLENDRLRNDGSVEYSWRHRGNWNSLRAVTIGAPASPPENSEEEFITEHYWGYTAQRDGSCKEYKVEHDKWRLWRTQAASLQCDIATLYGTKFAETLAGAPQSAFVAEGSSVTVSSGVTL
jgi:uncharacterized protein YqjF (DUF2071 family)